MVQIPYQAFYQHQSQGRYLFFGCSHQISGHPLEVDTFHPFAMDDLHHQFFVVTQHLDLHAGGCRAALCNMRKQFLTDQLQPVLLLLIEIKVIAGLLQVFQQDRVLTGHNRKTELFARQNGKAEQQAEGDRNQPAGGNAVVRNKAKVGGNTPGKNLPLSASMPTHSDTPTSSPD